MQYRSPVRECCVIIHVSKVKYSKINKQFLARLRFFSLLEVNRVVIEDHRCLRTLPPPPFSLKYYPCVNILSVFSTFIILGGLFYNHIL